LTSLHIDSPIVFPLRVATPYAAVTPPTRPVLATADTSPHAVLIVISPATTI
jgi:hypothetical protein